MTIRNKFFLGNIVPESNWNELDKNSYNEVYDRLQKGGQYCSATLEYLKNNNVKLGYHAQDNSGGGWTFFRNITLAPGENPNDPYTLSLIIHEVFHLQQSMLVRLSVFGELRAWQYQKKAYYEIAEKEIGEIGQAFSGKQDLWDEIAKLIPDSRDDLAQAQELMGKIATGYRSDCLPLYPLSKEIWYHLIRGEFRAGYDAVKNLVTCR